MARQAEQTELLLHFLVFIYDMPAAAAAKWLQSCPTLCDPVDGSPPGSTVPGIIQAILLILARQCREKATATHCSTLAWTIPWMEEPGGLHSLESQRVGHD